MKHRLIRIRRRALAAPVALAALVSFPGLSAEALPLLSEVYYDAVGSDDGQSFVELFGVPGTVLDELRIEVVNGANGAVVATLPLSGVIGPTGLFVVADRFSDGGTAVPVFDQLLNFDIQNGPDSVVLVGPDGVLDALGFGAFESGEIFAGEGTAAPAVPAGSSLARVFANVDTDDNALDFVELLAPTPGEAPIHPVPEPATGLLSAAGALGLGWLGRRRSRPRRPHDRQRRPAPQ
ncbi:PEP-CTERM sorting domain-containing protein [Myxococcota bacterium]|nr:PEP-CTERM sorting domain-containing protein [Myxococcota bacterium]MCZ7620017.1 PEP-CTERM sorting domain-containing protein [Myxococcota bacterium]